ncbi:MAG: ATP-binding protein, partial [Rhodospirillaceae bacterium]|nr:ATP-binding protein [Rhodospirillaceae bacterium]
MRLKEISAKNYRTLQDIVIHFSPDYCTLSGKNNAGKSCVIRLLCHLMEPQHRFWRHQEYPLDYGEDRTQWAKGEDKVTIQWKISLSASDDPALISTIEVFSGQKTSGDEVEINITIQLDDGSTTTNVSVNGEELEDRASREIVSKLRSSNCMFLHNSAEHEGPIFLSRQGRRQT